MIFTEVELAKLVQFIEANINLSLHYYDFH